MPTLLTRGSVAEHTEETREGIPAESALKTHGGSGKISLKRGLVMFKYMGYRPNLAKYEEPEGSSRKFISTLTKTKIHTIKNV